MSVKIALVGAVQSTERALQVLARSGNAPAILLTLPPEKSSRHSDYVDLHPLANSLGVPVIDTGDVNDPLILARLAEFDLDVAMVIGWSRLCGPEFVAMPRLGTIGFHPALLPAMRGRAALAWTILLDVRETGATLFWIDDGVDSGPIARQKKIALSGTETLAQLMDLQLEALGSMLEGLIRQLSDGARPAIEQDQSAATYLALRRPEDGEIDWTLPAPEIERLIRAVSRPYPGAFTFLRGQKLTIWSARVASYPQWFALTGQIFTFAGDEPVVRCGKDTDLILVDYELEEVVAAGEKAPSLRGQPRLGRPI